MKTLVIIPSRMSATRLPGKPLLKINGKSIISHVFKRAESAEIGEVVVATEDIEIVNDIKIMVETQFLHQKTIKLEQIEYLRHLIY
jgi:CMP-2-keto-3-deoxyoctulosonic acid synthetase